MKFHLNSLILLFLFVISLASAVLQGYSNNSPKTITVFAAASLTESFKKIGEAFEASHPDTKIIFNFAGSQNLLIQLQEGAQADIFASANNRELERAIKKSLISSNSQKIFAKNTLIVIYPKNNPGKIKTLTDLGKSGLKLDIADKSVPAGQYTLDILDKMSDNKNFGKDFKKKVLANVVSLEDNVKSVLTKVSLGEADAGIVYVSDITGTASKKIETIEIPKAFNQIALYPIAPLTASKEPQIAKEFIDFVLSKTGQKILKEQGFIPVNQ